MKMQFQELTTHRQQRLRELFTARFALKGEADPAAAAEKFIKLKKPKTPKQWHTLGWYAMQSVDKKRVAMGLPRLYTDEIGRGLHDKKDDETMKV